MGGETRVASRERWGRPDRSRVPGATGRPSGPRSATVRGRWARSGRSRVPVGSPSPGHHGTATREGSRTAMLRLLHTADVHLGARHADLGEAAAAQRERQFAAFRAAVDLAIAEKVDLFLVAGDLFDSNVQPRRSVERVAAELRRLAAGPHPLGARPGHARRVRPRVRLPRLRPAGPRRTRRGRRDGRGPDAGPPVDPPPGAATRSSTARASRPSGRRTARSATWPRSRRPTRPGSIGCSTPSVAIPGRTDGDEVVITAEEIAASGLDYLALGHWHSRAGRADQGRHLRLRGRAGAGRGRPGQGRQGAARDARRRQNGQRTVEIEERDGRQDPVRAARDRRRDGRVAARARRRLEARRTRTSCSTSG